MNIINFPRFPSPRKLIKGERIVHPERKHVVAGIATKTCPSHGDYEETLWELQPVPEGVDAAALEAIFRYRTACPTCCEEQRLAVVRNRPSASEAAESYKMLLDQRLLTAGIPKRFLSSTIWGWTASMPVQKPAIEWARSYCEDTVKAISSGRSAILHGSAGTGKTHLAVGILRHVIEQGGTGIYATCADMLGMVRATYQKGSSDTEQSVIDRLAGVDLLVIDELGRTTDSSHEQATFFRILDTRYRNMKPTIIVSNLDRDPLVAMLGVAAIDRIRESGGAILTFNWTSQRQA